MRKSQEYEYPKEILIKPWVGANFTNTNPKVLIMGESIYYLGGIKKEDILNEYISTDFSGETEHKFFKAIRDCYSSPKHWYAEKDDLNNYSINKKEFWDDVAFYEFVQYKLKNANDRPSKEHWEKSKEPFLKVLNILEPDIVIAIGFATFDHLPDEGESVESIFIGKDEMRIWKYTLESKKKVEVLRTHHASRGFNSDVWIQLMDKYLQTRNRQALHQ